MTHERSRLHVEKPTLTLRTFGTAEACRRCGWVLWGLLILVSASGAG